MFDFFPNFPKYYLFHGLWKIDKMEIPALKEFSMTECTQHSIIPFDFILLFHINYKKFKRLLVPLDLTITWSKPVMSWSTDKAFLQLFSYKTIIGADNWRFQIGKWRWIETNTDIGRDFFYWNSIFRYSHSCLCLIKFTFYWWVKDYLKAANSVNRINVSVTVLYE